MKVTPTGTDGYEWTFDVQSESDEAHQHCVTLFIESKKAVCSCPAFHFRLRGRPGHVAFSNQCCKHMIAVVNYLLHIAGDSEQEEQT